jgi:hypothetical protein
MPSDICGPGPPAFSGSFSMSSSVMWFATFSSRTMPPLGAINDIE